MTDLALLFVIHCPACRAVVATVDVGGDDWHEAESWAFLASAEHQASCAGNENARAETLASSPACPVPEDAPPSIPDQLDQVARDPHASPAARQLAQLELDAGLANTLSTAGVRFSTVDRERDRA